MDQENKQSTNEEKPSENTGVAPPPPNLPQGEPNIPRNGGDTDKEEGTQSFDTRVLSQNEEGLAPTSLDQTSPDSTGLGEAGRLNERPLPYGESEKSLTEEIVIPPLEDEKEGGGLRSGKKLFFVGALTLVFLLAAGAAAYVFFSGGFSSEKLPQIEIPIISEKESGTEPIGEEVATETPPQNQDQEESPSDGPQERDRRRKDDLSVLLLHLQRYGQDSGGTYPKTEGLDRISASHESILAEYLIPKYISSLPYDPQPDFFYGYRSDGAIFQLSAVLEINEDPECVMEGTFCIYRVNERGEVVTRK